jgi:hypothetical protein
MRKLLVGMAVVFIPLAAFSVTLDDLNLPRDPENVEVALKGKAVRAFDLRSGPAEQFPVMVTAPEGARVAVTGWREGWLRVWYGDTRGWIDAADRKGLPIKREEGPLCPVEVSGDRIKMYVRYYENEPLITFSALWLNQGDVLNFRFDAYYDEKEETRGSIGLLVEHEGAVGWIVGYSPAPRPGRVEPEDKRGWLVEFDQGILKYDLSRGYDKVYFLPLDGRRNPKLYAGPGSEYEEVATASFRGPVYFVERDWALVLGFEDYEWLYIGTDEKPAVNFFGYYTDPFERCCPIPADMKADEADVGVYAVVKTDYWPDRRRVYIDLSTFYGCRFFDRAVVDTIRVFQPPDADEPLCSGPAGKPFAWSWYEAGFLTHSLEVPAAFDFDKAFRLVGEMHYGGAQEFEMEFRCNAEDGD